MTGLTLNADGMNGIVEFGTAQAAFTSNYVGDYNAENIRVAAAIALSLGHRCMLWLQP